MVAKDTLQIRRFIKGEKTRAILADYSLTTNTPNGPLFPYNRSYHSP